MEFLIVTVIFVGLPGTIGGLLWALLRQRNSYALALKELEIQEIEAKAKLITAQHQGDLPEYVDRDDPVEVEAWQRARVETAQAAAKQL